jgi:hypothetical protein
MALAGQLIGEPLDLWEIGRSAPDDLLRLFDGIHSTPIISGWVHPVNPR